MFSHCKTWFQVSLTNIVALSVEAVKFRRLHFCRGVRPSHKYPGYDTKLHLMVRLQFWSFGEHGECENSNCTDKRRKILFACIARIITGGHKGIRGTDDLLYIDQYILKGFKTKRKNLVLTSLDYILKGGGCNGYVAGLRNRSKRVRTPVALLRSVSDKYPWERYEPSLSYELNSTITVFLEEWIWH